MGNSQPIHSNDFVKNFDKNFSHIRDVNDERWGFANVFKDKSGPLLAMITNNNLDNDVDYLTVIKRLQNHNPEDHELVADYLGWSCLKSDDLCGDHRKIDIYTEYFDENLRKEIFRRQSGRLNYFVEEELWYLIESGVSLGAYWEQQNTYHGDFRPNQILFTNEGLYKMCDNSLVGLYRNNYFLTLNSTTRGYLSPELINHYRRRDVNPKYDVYRADVYSLGMTLLQAASLREPETNFYDWPNEKILHKQIQQALLDLESHYSRELVDTIRLMLEEDEYTRPDFLGLAGGRVPKRQAAPFLPRGGLPASVIPAAPVFAAPVQAPVYNLPVQTPAPLNLYQSVAAPAPVYQVPQVFNPPAPVYNLPPSSSFQPQVSSYQASAPQFASPSFQAPPSFAPARNVEFPQSPRSVPAYQESAPAYNFPQSFQPQVTSYQGTAPQYVPQSFQAPPSSFAPARNVELPQSPQAFRQQPQFSSPAYRAPPQQYQSQPQVASKPQGQAQSQEQPKDVKEEINDLDKRVRDAIKNSEEAIKRNAGLPVKSA